MLNLSTMSLPDLRMDDGWMDGWTHRDFYQLICRQKFYYD
jgi:hypothetical protein